MSKMRRNTEATTMSAVVASSVVCPILFALALADYYYSIFSSIDGDGSQGGK